MPVEHATSSQQHAGTSKGRNDHDRSPSRGTYEVVVIGGGAAGLSAAVALARFRRSVVVVDQGNPRNAVAGHVHNLLTRDGASPAELYSVGRTEVARFGGEFVASAVRAVRGQLGAFTLELEDETTITAGRVIVASGGWDELPRVTGLAERWGRDVLHCGFCHGYEVRDQHVGVLATGPMAIHQALMFRLLTPQVTLLAHTAPPTPEQADDLSRRGISIVPGPVEEVLSDQDHLTGVRLADGTHVGIDALIVATVVNANADFLAPLGLVPTNFAVNGHTVATRIETGPSGSTDVPGVRIAGNTTEPMAQVVNSAASGLAAASAMIGEFAFAQPSHQ